MTRTCLTRDCDRTPIPTTDGGTSHVHCAACETRLLGEAFGPVSWTDRALTNTLPGLVVGGIPIEPLDPEVTVAALVVPSVAAAVTPASSGQPQPVRAG